MTSLLTRPDPFTEDDELDLRDLVDAVYQGIAHDLGRCHVEDFVDAFHGQVDPRHLGAWMITFRNAAVPAVRAFVDLDDWAESVVLDQIRKWADRKGWLG